MKSGVTDPDYDYDISGWQGRVTHIDTEEATYMEIAWDSVTLNQMPDKSLKKDRPSCTDHFKLKGFKSIDDLRGILVKVKRIADNKVFILALWDLKTEDGKDQNHQYIVDYSFWMSNYR